MTITKSALARAAAVAGLSAAASFALFAQQPVPPNEARDKQNQAAGQGSTDAPQIDVVAELKDPAKRFNAAIGQPSEVTPEMFTAGQRIVAQGSKQGAEAVACVSCHGANGQGNPDANVPRIAGLPAWYLHKQLNDYAEGRRQNAIMTGIAQQLDQGERRATSVYYSLLIGGRDTASEKQPAPEAAAGKRIYFEGKFETGLPACSNCHGGEGKGIPPSVPSIAGQHAEYIQLQLQAWQQGDRKNDAQEVMRAVVRKMSPEDITAVSKYLAANAVTLRTASKP
jgi:cytochrome c553